MQSMKHKDTIRFFAIILFTFLWIIFTSQWVEILFKYFWIEEWKLTQSFITYFLLFPFVVIWIFLILIGIFFLYEKYINIQYKKFKQQYAWKTFFIYGKFHSDTIQKHIIPQLKKNIIICDMNRKKDIRDFWGIKRFLIWKLHLEADNYQGRKQKSPYIVKICDDWQNIRALSIRSHLANAKDCDTIVKEIHNFIS